MGVQVNVGMTAGVALGCGDGVTDGVVVSGVEVITGTGVAVSNAASGVWLCFRIGVRLVVGGSPPLDPGRRTRSSTRSTTTAAAAAAMRVHRDQASRGELLRSGGTTASSDGA